MFALYAGFLFSISQFYKQRKWGLKVAINLRVIPDITYGDFFVSILHIYKCILAPYGDFLFSIS